MWDIVDGLDKIECDVRAVNVLNVVFVFFVRTSNPEHLLGASVDGSGPLATDLYF